MPGLPLFEVFHILRCKGEIFILPGLLLKPHLLVGCMLHTLSGVFQLLKLLVWVGNCYCPIFCISLWVLWNSCLKSMKQEEKIQIPEEGTFCVVLCFVFGGNNSLSLNSLKSSSNLLSASSRVWFSACLHSWQLCINKRGANFCLNDSIGIHAPNTSVALLYVLNYKKKKKLTYCCFPLTSWQSDLNADIRENFDVTKSVWFSKFHGSKYPIVVFDFQTMEMWSFLRTTIWCIAYICNTECAGSAAWWQPEVDVCHFFCDLVIIRWQFHTNVVPSQDTTEGNHHNWHDFFLLFYKF